MNPGSNKKEEACELMLVSRHPSTLKRYPLGDDAQRRIITRRKRSRGMSQIKWRGADSCVKFFGPPAPLVGLQTLGWERMTASLLLRLMPDVIAAVMGGIKHANVSGGRQPYIAVEHLSGADEVDPPKIHYRAPIESQP